MKVLLNPTTAEIIEKKSRFISNIFFVSDVSEAEEKLNTTRKKYYDAKHNCYAYVLGLNGDNVKSSDDGEPQGTAGHPMLDILNGNKITNCIAIVTRYFGGILLGTGGLVRAYSDSLKKAIESAEFSDLMTAYRVNFEINYDDYGKIENIVQNLDQFNVSSSSKSVSLANNQIYSLNKTFENVVKLEYLVGDEVFEKFSKEVMNITRGKVALENNDKKIYYIRGKEVIYL